MKTFTEFVIDNHPDPDSIYGGKWDEIEKMAKAYASEREAELRNKIEDKQEEIFRLRDQIKLCNIDQLNAESENTRLREVLEKVRGYINDGTLVRDISKDHEPEWAIKMMRFVSTLKEIESLNTKVE